jgi:hypothetical protein
MGQATERPSGFGSSGGKEFPVLAQAPGISDQSFGQDRSVVDGLTGLRPPGIEEIWRQVAQIEALIADFDRMVDALGDAIQAEQNRTRIHDPAHVAYSTSARAMMQRRDNLNRSIAALKRQLADAKVALD